MWVWFNLIVLCISDLVWFVVGGLVVLFVDLCAFVVVVVDFITLCWVCFTLFGCLLVFRLFIYLIGCLFDCLFK